MSNQKTAAFYTLGCKVNQYDAQAMKEIFENAGYEVINFGEKADVNVILTCIVTAIGEQKSRQMLHRVKREQPESQLIAAGCLAQKDAERLKDLGARLIIGNQHRENVLNLLDEAMKEDSQIVAVDDVKKIPFEELTVSRQDGRTRAIMKIQEGCDRWCAYCIIPSVRGGIRSRSPETIREEALRLQKAGYEEIVLTGIHLTSYGKDLDGASLLDAIKAAAVPGLNRLRLGSLEPVIATQEFVEQLSQIKAVCPQFHLSMQSGSDTVLNRMKRRYTAQEYREAAQRMKDAFPDCALTTDVIAGFPGETDKEFDETLAFCKDMGFAKMHVFPFSRRAGTLADKMPGQLPRAVKQERARKLSQLDKEMSEAFRIKMLGRVEEVLFETVDDAGIATGHTRNGMSVYVKNAEAGSVESVRLTALERDGFEGRRVDTL